MGAPRIISLHTILGPPDHFLHLLYGAPQICFFSYNMGAPLKSVSLFTIWAPLRSVSLHAIGGATSHLVFCSQNIWGPHQISFSAYTIWGPLRSVSVHPFWGPLSDQFFLLLYGALSDQFLHILYGGPLRSVSSPTIWGFPEISFFAYYMRAPLRLVSSFTMGPH